MPEIKTDSILTCPQCGHAELLEMPSDRYVVIAECSKCKTMLKPEKGDCCVFCSYGDTPCPPEQDPDGGCSKKG